MTLASMQSDQSKVMDSGREIEESLYNAILTVTERAEVKAGKVKALSSIEKMCLLILS